MTENRNDQQKMNFKVDPEYMAKMKAKIEENEDPTKNPKFFESNQPVYSALPDGYVDLDIEPRFDPAKELSGSFIDVKKFEGIQPMLVSYGEDWSGAPLCIFGEGDFSIITGLSKSRKSFFKSAMVAAYIGMQDDSQWPFFRTHRKTDKIVIDIDTEQGPYHARKAFRRVTDLCGGQYKNYFPFAWRRYTPSQRLIMLRHLIEKYKDRIGLISIDGYIDLVDDYMDATEATSVVSELMSWTDKYGIHITGILHLNPNGEKMIGHLGSIFMRKAVSIIKVAKDKHNKNLSIINHDRARDMEFTDFTMKVENGLPLFDEVVDYNEM